MKECRSYTIFLNTIKTDSTKDNYVYWLTKYLEYKQKDNDSILTHDDLIKDPPEKIQTDFENYILYLKNHRKSVHAIKMSVFSLLRFFSMNRIILNEKILKELIPRDESSHKRQTYSDEDIVKILNARNIHKIKKHRNWWYTKPRSKAIILFFASSGVRLGGLESLTYGDIEEIEDCFSVKVYAGTKYEYLTFITPQARKALEEYLGLRKNLTHDSKLFDIEYDAIRKLLERLVTKAKVTPIQMKKVRQWNNETIDVDLVEKHFKEVPVVHGFRSRWNTIMKSNNEINKSMIELMMGHKPEIKLDENYFKPTKENLFEEYKKGITTLTVNSHIV